MEPIESEIIAIVYIKDGWYLIDLRSMVTVSAAYQIHADAEQGAQTRSWRIAQGWEP